MSAKFRFFSFAILALGLAFGVISASAQERPVPPSPPDAADAPPAPSDAPPMRKMGRHHKMRGHGGMLRELRGIKLTDVQKEQVRVIRETFKPSQQEMDEMRTIMDAKRAGTLTADQELRMKALHTAMEQRNENIRIQVMGILTADQRAQIEQRKADREKRRAERREKMKQRRAAPKSDQ